VGYGLSTANASEAASENGPFNDSADIIFGEADIGAVTQPSSFDTGDQTPTATVAGGSASVPVAVNPSQNNAALPGASFLGGRGNDFWPAGDDGFDRRGRGGRGVVDFEKINLC